jgi:glucose/arabinose dehydrogenase
MKLWPFLAALSTLTLGVASFSATAMGENPAPAGAFTITPVAQFDEPWAFAFLPGTNMALITEMSGHLELWQDGGRVREVSGVPPVYRGGQAGLADVKLAPDFATSQMIYLSWVVAGEGQTRGAVVGRARLVLDGAPKLEDLQVIWRQTPMVTGDGQFSNRLAFSPDGKYLFVASGERQKLTPAQDMSGNLGKILRLLPDGTPAPGNPFAAKGGVTAQIWTLGHRNVLGLKFDAAGRLWGLEHGPKGGDELNLIKPGRNYGWPLVSEGDDYDGTPIPRHATRPDLAAPAMSWNPVIAPGDFIFYRGDRFPGWRGQAIVTAMKPAAIVRVAITGERAREVARVDMPTRIREIAESDDGTIWVLEDGKQPGSGRLLADMNLAKPGGRLLKLTPGDQAMTK